jgi:hypothetical protein
LAYDKTTETRTRSQRSRRSREPSARCSCSDRAGAIASRRGRSPGHPMTRPKAPSRLDSSMPMSRSPAGASAGLGPHSTATTTLWSWSRARPAKTWATRNAMSARFESGHGGRSTRAGYRREGAIPEAPSEHILCT